MSFKPLAPTQSRSQQVVDQIAAQIQSGELARGAQLPSETQLATQFGVSRSVIREGVKLLEAIGLVISHQGKGSFVRHDPGPAVSRVLDLSVQPDEAAVHELFEFREQLEVAAARFAAERHREEDLAKIRERLAANAEAVQKRDADGFTETDWLFHSAIAEATRNRYLAVVLTAVREMQHDVVSLMSDDIGSTEEALKQHRAIVNHIAEHDADSAEQAIREHIHFAAASVEANRETR